jgi:hypothetical protein
LRTSQMVIIYTICTNIDGLEVFENQSNRLPMPNGELLE